ncbi:signal recognition particle-docking protein FtsY [Cognatiyoonia koreensis]|uniref:Signal recognition particle receptor FtsY n=1 Tax=Cognatiyoonia koreensis TaxID=364200 RepID=A0A1I0NEG2_9RHOB|nr:signal recognition particle-docking protein FtsY [Cognatiyoonia koreensis]SEV99527.1 signal recognition particle-docking protein FtsY [Cognatiyoonia koreensis]
MSFFKKLKDRMFRSSSKIDEGLDAIVNDGGEAEEVTVDTAAEEAEAARLQAVEDAERERAAAEAEAQRLKDDEAAAAREAEAARVAEEQRQKEEDARVAAQAQEAKAAEERAAQELEAKAAEERAAAQALEAKTAEERAAQEREAKAAEARAAEERAAREAAEIEAERLAAEERAAKDAEAARLAAEAEAARVTQEEEAIAQAEAAEGMSDTEIEALAEEIEEQVEAAVDAANAPPVREAVVAPMTTLTPSALDEDEPKAGDAQKGLLGRFFGREKKTVVRRTLDDDMLEQLEELLITADMGVDTALRVTANMAEGRLGKKLSVAEIKELMAQEITRIMDGVARPMPLYAHKPQVVLVVGVNGSGKTTTIGKLASQFKAAGKKVVIAAGDTFRAAAVEQLQVWGDRAGVPVLTAPEGSDPASLAFDAMEKAQQDGADLLMIDTAGRLQNRSDLMEELSKIVRVIRKKDPDAPHNTLLVLDATTGQNALQQVKVFQELADVSGLVMTKLDGTAKGGVLVALADKFGLPIHAIGVGEQIDDLAPFDPEDFANALVGLDR